MQLVGPGREKDGGVLKSEKLWLLKYGQWGKDDVTGDRMAIEDEAALCQ